MKRIRFKFPMLACFVFAASLLFAGPAPADDDHWGFSVGPSFFPSACVIG